MNLKISMVGSYNGKKNVFEIYHIVFIPLNLQEFGVGETNSGVNDILFDNVFDEEHEPMFSPILDDE